MRLARKLASIVFATSVAAGAMDGRLLRLIGPDTRIVCGVDLHRYRNSALAALFPADMQWVASRSGLREIQQVVTIVANDPGARPLLVLTGQPSGEQRRPPDEIETTSVLYRGRSILSNEEYGSMVRLDGATLIMGDPVRVREAIVLWEQEDRRLPDLAGTVQRLGGAFDIWFASSRPLDMERPDPTRVLKYRDQLVQVVEEARGGVRLGYANEVSLELLLRTADDAVAVAALGRWLPGLIQLREPHGIEGSLVDLAENLQVQAQGRTATASFRISEAALKKLADTRRPIE